MSLLESVTLDLINLIRLNGFEVEFRDRNGRRFLTIFEPFDENEQTYDVSTDGGRVAIDRVASRYCTAQQRAQLLLLIRSVAA